MYSKYDICSYVAITENAICGICSTCSKPLGTSPLYFKHVSHLFLVAIYFIQMLALILKMSLYYLTYEYDCKVELYILCDVADFQYYYINIDYTSMNMNFNTIFTCFTVHVHIIGMCQFFSYSTLT